jgi:hypothetical protein
MHGGGQWASFIGFYGGGTSLNTDHHFDASTSRMAPRARHSIMVVGDAMARRSRRFAARRHDLSSCVIGSGGAILSKASRSPTPLPTRSHGQPARRPATRHGHDWIAAVRASP